jgi:hypothetical protein
MPANPQRPGVPPPTAFDLGLATNRVLCVRLQNERGEKMRFLVDTGSPITIFNSTFRPKLGPVLGTEAVQYAWAGNAQLQVHAAPRLFLNNTLLLSGPHVWSDDLRRVWPGRGIDGILGLDFLEHYCVQFDFPNRTIRFLDPEHTNESELGRPYPLYTFANKTVFVLGNFLNAGLNLYEIDTGCTVDSVMKPPAFELACRKQPPEWTRQYNTGEGRPVTEAGFLQGTFDGQIYHKLVVDEANHNFLGLRFLSRHILTLNFPKHTMYLRRTAEG